MCTMKGARASAPGGRPWKWKVPCLTASRRVPPSQYSWGCSGRVGRTGGRRSAPEMPCKHGRRHKRTCTHAHTHTCSTHTHIEAHETATCTQSAHPPSRSRCTPPGCGPRPAPCAGTTAGACAQWARLEGAGGAGGQEVWARPLKQGAPWGPTGRAPRRLSGPGARSHDVSSTSIASARHAYTWGEEEGAWGGRGAGAAVRPPPDMGHPPGRR